LFKQVGGLIRGTSAIAPACLISNWWSVAAYWSSCCRSWES